jgi:hypothetical protein
MIVCSIFGIICAFVFLIIVITHRHCHTLTIFLVFNSTVAGLIANITCISQAIYQLIDLGDDSLCIIRSFFLKTGTGALYHSLCVQALHRLFVTVYSTRRYLQTRRFHIYMIIIQWIFSATFSLPIVLTNRIKYQPGSRICQVKLTDFFSLFVEIIKMI